MRGLAVPAGSPAEVMPWQATQVWSRNSLAPRAAGFVAGLRGERGCRCRLVGLPGVEVRGRLGDDEEAHPRVLRPAVLGAGAQVGARRRPPGSRRGWGARGWRRSCARGRHPEVVDDVGRLDADEEAAPDGDVDLVGGDHARGGIAHLPPPLVADRPPRRARDPPADRPRSWSARSARGCPPARRRARSSRRSRAVGSPRSAGARRRLRGGGSGRRCTAMRTATMAKMTAQTPSVMPKRSAMARASGEPGPNTEGTPPPGPTTSPPPLRGDATDPGCSRQLASLAAGRGGGAVSARQVGERSGASSC